MISGRAFRRSFRASARKRFRRGAVSDMAFRVGDYLANEVEGRNDQEKLLAELWKVADEQEQHTIANLMVKFVQHSKVERRSSLLFV